MINNPYVKEFLQRKCLADIGYRFDGDRIDDRKAQAFVLISNSLAKIRNEQATKKKKGR